MGLGCFWEKDMDSRGLSRHQATCKHYQKASTLATEKRWEWAKILIQALRKFTSHRDQLQPQGSHGNTTVSKFNITRELPCRLMYQTSTLEPIRSTKDCQSKHIVHCATYAFTMAGAKPERINPDTQASNAHVGASVLQGLGFALEADVAEGYRDIPGMHLHISVTVY
jgi:hypothetical protein